MEQVNHPDHYQHGGLETIEMMARIWGNEGVALFCRMNAFKYRMRAGYKDNVAQEIEKAKWYENKALEYERKD